MAKSTGSEAVRPLPRAEVPIHPSLRDVFRTFNNAGIRWCLLRGEDDLHAPSGDVDILVDRADAKRIKGLLARLMYVQQPTWGRGSHTFYFTYYAPTDSWIKLDIVTDLTYGPDFTLRTQAETGCLARRQHDGDLAVLAPDDGFWTLLLHCMLDKAAFAPRRATRLRELAEAARTDGPMAQIVERVCPAECAADRLLAAVRQEDWRILEKLAPKLLSSWMRHQGIRARVRGRISGRLRSSKVLRAFGGKGISVALLGPDGAGKSTLAAGIARSYYHPVRYVYMGLWPRSAEQRIRLRLPGIGWATRMLKVWQRYTIARLYCALGHLVVFDRYTFDALLPAGTPQILRRRISNWLLAHACPAPDLVFVLDAPGSLMFKRKGEHNPEHLEAQRQAFLRISQRLPNARIIDTTRGEESVRREVVGDIWRHMSARAQ